MSRRYSQFSHIRSEGGLLPPELLDRISRFDRTLPGLKADDYHLNINRRLNEKIEQSWKEVLSNWNVFQQRADEDQQVTLTTLTRERWLLPLFQEIGYERLQQANIRQLNNREYPISHEWNGLPLHLLGAGVDLDRRNPGVSGAARQSPHSMMQQFLNASENHHWGLLSNGFKLRILRDSTRLTRQAYVEFDLYSILEGEVYSDFALLWLLCHQSRLENGGDLECWLEHWSKEAQEQGTQALDKLRDGVQRSLEHLGAGFIRHPQNKQLIQKLESGELPGLVFYGQLLRLVYRLLFLCVAEDRDLLHPEESEETSRQYYHDFFSLTQQLPRGDSKGQLVANLTGSPGNCNGCDRH